MMRWLWIFSLLLAVKRNRGELSPPERSYKILMLLPVSSTSHRNVFIPVTEALADRGHQITWISDNEKKIFRNPNIHEIDHGLRHMHQQTANMFEMRKAPGSGLGLFIDVLPAMARELYVIPEVKEVYEKRKEFDLIVFDHMFNELAYPFAHEMAFITIATPGMDPRQSAVLGNPLNPSYVENLMDIYDLSTVFGRLRNVLAHITVAVYWRNWAIVPLVQKEITAQFPDLPPLLEIERNMSLSLLNSISAMESPLPLLPTQVAVGGMHCRPGRPLPQNFKSWIEGAGSAGVIYFSLGSVAKGEAMPVQYRNMFIEAFRKMEQRVIWKFEGELKDVPKNVMISKWLPQQDILAHPNVKVFITHGGLLSTQEAACHGVPLLPVPIFGDQPRNAEKAVKNGFGLSLNWEELTVDRIVETLQELIKNPKYRKTMDTISRLAKDEIDSPVDRAVFWTEYVIRHQGAPRLRSPAIQLSWVEFLLLDVVALLLLIVVVLLVILRWILRKILRMVFGSSHNKKKRD